MKADELTKKVDFNISNFDLEVGFQDFVLLLESDVRLVRDSWKHFL